MTRKVFEKKDIDVMKLNYYIRTLKLFDPPQGIVPPPIISYTKYPYLTYDAPPYDFQHDYWGKCVEEVRSAIAQSLQGWSNDINKIDRVGVWLSGGIDSALLVAFAAELLGPDKVRAYNMKFGEIQDETDKAQEVCDHLGVKLMTKFLTPQDSFPIIKTASYWLRAPTWCPHVYSMAQWCKEDGTDKCLIGLGLDALTGGEWDHYLAQNDPILFLQKENEILDTQRCYHWANFYQARGFVDLKCPYMDSQKLVFYLKSLPICHKVEGLNTKLRIRREVIDANILPEKIANYGLKAGTKKGFGPNWVEWFSMGYEEWSLQHDPATKGFDITPFGTWREAKSCWLKLLLSSTYYFYELIEEGAFAVDYH